MTSTILPSVSGPSPGSADHLCDDCSNMGHEIRQLCEDKDFKISKPRASVERNRSTCAFCGVLAPHFRLVPGASEGNIDIFSNKPGWRSSRSDSHYDTNGIDELVIRDRKGTGLILLDVLTTESESLFLLLIDKERCLGLTVDTGSAPAIAKHVSGRCIKPASNLDRAKDWLNDCIHNHNHNQVRTAICPSRLVAVGTADGAEPIKIVDDSGADKKYLAVSYRWGAETLLTTSETFELFHIAIPWKQLPQTFQDAIHIAREFGIRYMWIDSLCIIQDNLADWETESAKMADIYKGALLTIMAASASDSQGGFFRDRVMMKGSVALPYTDANGTTEFSVFVRETPQSFSLSIWDSPLFQRGWVFQERLMSRRKLIFGKDQTFWECDGVPLSESNIQGRTPYERDQMEIKAAFRVFSDPSCEVAERNGSASPERLWKNLVGDYSQCALTYQADRLPALRGLARTFAQRFGGSYAAGLWQNHMPDNLMWCVIHRSSKETHKGDDCVPSWSWASTGGQIYFPRLGSPNSTLRPRSDLEVVSININLAGQDPYGRVCPGSSIYLRGRLRSGRLVAREEDEYTAWLETEHGRLRRRGFLDRNDEDLPLEVSFLEVSHGFDGTHAWSHYLLLHRTGTDNHFRRVGLVDFDEVNQAEDYLFRGIGKQLVTLV